MRYIFTPIFLATLTFSILAHALDVSNYEAILAVTILFFGASLCCYVLKLYIPGYVLIAVSLGLLITGQFVKEKTVFEAMGGNPLSIPGDRYVTVEGVLTDFPQIQPEHSIINLSVHHVTWAKTRYPVAFNARIKVKGHLRDILRGDSVVVDTRLYQSSLHSNFFPNGIKNHFLVTQSHFNGQCKSSQLLTVTSKGNWFWRVIGGWRHTIRDAIEKKFTQLEDSRGSSNSLSTKTVRVSPKGVLLLAMLLGDRGELLPADKERLLGAGVFHLLAISGAHIGIIGLGCLLLLRVCRVPLKKRLVITALVLVLFLALSGFKISAQRAVLMALMIFSARLLLLDIDIYNTISFCGLLLLIMNPTQFLDAGFILTITLTAAIALGRNLFLPMFQGIQWNRWLPPSPKQVMKKYLRDNQPSQEKIVSAQKKNGPAKRFTSLSYLYELVSANISASLTALPLSLFFFKRYSLAGIFAGLLLVPLTAVILGGAFLLLPLAPVSPFLSHLLLTMLDLPLSLFLQVVKLFSDHIDLTIFRGSPPFWLLLGFLVTFVLLTLSRTTKQKIVRSGLLMVLLLAICLNLFHYAPSHLETFFVDVGQGDSQIVVFPGGDALLIDGGGTYYSNFQVGKNILLPFILQKRIDIKWVAVTHYHADHVRGINEILHILKPEQLWLSSTATDDPLYKELMASKPASVEIVHIAAPTIKNIGDCTVQWLFPEQFITASRSSNNHSQVMKISDGFHSFLFTGDIEKEVESRLSDDSCSMLRADVLKVSHHGSSTSSTMEFIKCVSPRLAVFSYGLRNRFRFPHRPVTDNFKSLDIPTLATARRGAIHIISLPHRLKIDTSK